MVARLLLLFLVLPLAELYLLLRFASVTGIPTTIGLVILTGVCGSMLAARQGSQAIRNFRTAISQGRVPSSEAVDGIMIAFAAALLLTPGLITDSLGIVLLIPWSRAKVRNWLIRRYSGRFKVVGYSSREPGDSGSPAHDDVVDATFRPSKEPAQNTPFIETKPRPR